MPVPYANFFMDSRDILIMLDKTGHILEVNRAALKAYGYSSEEFLDLTIFDLQVTETSVKIPQQMRQAMADGIMFETLHRRKDQSTFPVEVTAKSIFVRGNNLIMNIIRDISQRRERELSLKESNEELMATIEELTATNEQLVATEEELRQQYDELQSSRDELATLYQQQTDIIEFLPDATFILDQEQRVIAWNRAIEEMTGVLKESIIGRGDFAYSIPFFGQPTPGLIGLFMQNKPNQIQYRNVKRQGHTITGEVFAPALYGGKGAYLQLKTSLLFNARGETIAAIESIRDISEIKLAQKALVESEARFRSLAENALDMIYQIDFHPTPHFSYINAAAEKITGYQPEEFYVDTNVHRRGIHPEDWPLVANVLAGDFNAKATLRWQHRHGHLVWLEIFRVPVYDPSGKLVAIQGIARDINERKMLEEKLLYLSQHDTITGLHSRSFFEEEMTRLEDCASTVGFIMIDLDGLKLINDTFGHKAGDQMLIEVANILREYFKDEPGLARIGGDEFAILLTGCTKEDLAEHARKIKYLIKEYNNKHPERPPLSLSIGFALRENNAKTMSQLFTEADNSMYREKLHRNTSSRSSIVTAMMKALETRDFITEGHGERLEILLKKVGKRLGLTGSQIFDLRLFAQFHDIGKVGIPDKILFKPGPLTADERKEMERHSELGYRIAQAAPELLPIADWILKHHEWWNGNGYPLGLKGEEIPLECRILAIADAYDAMCNDRPYRKALPHATIIEEIRRYAGVQFDPQLAELMIEIIEGVY